MVYFDNAATSYPKPAAVWEAMEHCLKKLAGSPGRGAHRGAVDVSRVVYESREVLSRFFNVPDSRQLVFTANATQAINLALFGLLAEGDHVVTTSMEHNAVVRPLRYLERTRNVTVTFVTCSPTSELDPADVEKAITPSTRLIAVNHASNVTGTVLPVPQIGVIARNHGLTYLVDAAQTAGSWPIDVQTSYIDLLAFTGHKGLLGPAGTGGLYIRQGLELEPLIHGGTGSRSELEEQPPFLPDRYESGTLNAAGIAGLGAAVKFIMETGLDSIMLRKAELARLLLQRLYELNGVTVYGTGNPLSSTAVVSITMDGIDPSEVERILDTRYGISVRSGLHCAPRAHKTIGTFPEGTVRLAPGYFTTDEDIDTVVEALREIAAGSG